MNIDLATLQASLERLRENSDEIFASALMTRDGMMVVADIADPSTEDRLAAMSAAVLSLGERIADELLQAGTERVMIKSPKGYIVVTAVAKDLLLTVIARFDAKLGMVFHDIEKVVKELKAI